MTSSKSWVKVGKLKSMTSPSGKGDEEFVVDVSPCSRASKESTPAVGRAFRISEANCANERPEEPAPWWATKSGPLARGGIIYTW